MVFEIKKKNKIYRFNRSEIIFLLSKTTDKNINNDTQNGKLFSILKKNKFLHKEMFNSLVKNLSTEIIKY